MPPKAENIFGTHAYSATLGIGIGEIRLSLKEATSALSAGEGARHAIRRFKPGKGIRRARPGCPRLEAPT